MTSDKGKVDPKVEVQVIQRICQSSTGCERNELLSTLRTEFGVKNPKTLINVLENKGFIRIDKSKNGRGELIKAQPPAFKEIGMM